MPPKFRKVQEASLDVGSDDTSDSGHEVCSEDKSPLPEESEEAENSDDEDEGLQVMEKNPQALKKMFADEVRE